MSFHINIMHLYCRTLLTVSELGSHLTTAYVYCQAQNMSTPTNICTAWRIVQINPKEQFASSTPLNIGRAVNMA